MSSKLETDLLAVAALTFEELGLMCPLEEADPEPLCEAPAVAASVSFDGVLSGALVLAAYGHVASALAANMLGEPEPLSGEKQLDALGEAANVMCGNLLPRLAGPTEVFSIAGPQETTLGARAGMEQQARLAAEVHLALDEGEILVRLHLDGGDDAKRLLL